MEEWITMILQVFGELIFQLLLEVISEIGIRTFTGRMRSPGDAPSTAFLDYLLLGGIIAAISLLFVPHHLISSPFGRIANMVLTPLLVGGFMMRLGSWRERRNQKLIRLDEFAFGYCFALEIALIRFFFAKT